MNIQSKLAVSIVLWILAVWILRNFIQKRLNSDQTLFWLCVLCGAEMLTLFPALVEKASLLWGNLIPVSWISFMGIVCLIAYLLHQAIKLNELRAHFVQLTRQIAFLEERVRHTESLRTSQ
ncbi:MAG: DUF2304 domain-containing protein [bacterium]|nr:DUF2304 domain-containing protein [bacterium]